MNYDLIQELVALHQRIAANGGVMRLSGLSSLNEKLLRSRGLDGRSPSYRNHLNVVFGLSPPGSRNMSNLQGQQLPRMPSPPTSIRKPISARCRDSLSRHLRRKYRFRVQCHPVEYVGDIMGGCYREPPAADRPLKTRYDGRSIGKAGARRDP